MSAVPSERSERRPLIRVALVVLAAVNLETAAWALIDPRGWFRNYPGLGRHWVGVQGPFNRHLAVDAGAGFLAVGVALAVAAVWMRRSAVVVALVVLLAHAVPHFAFHVSHPVPGFSTFDTLVGVWSIGVEALAAIVLLFSLRSRPVHRRGRTGRPNLRHADDPVV